MGVPSGSPLGAGVGVGVAAGAAKPVWARAKAPSAPHRARLGVTARRDPGTRQLPSTDPSQPYQVIAPVPCPTAKPCSLPA